MSSTQDMFEKDLEWLARDRVLRLAIDREWANTGSYRFYPAGTGQYQPVLTIEFYWQSGVVSLTMDPPGTKERWKFAELGDAYIEIGRLLLSLTRELPYSAGVTKS